MDVEMTSTRVSIRLAQASQGTRATKNVGFVVSKETSDSTHQDGVYETVDCVCRQPGRVEPTRDQSSTGQATKGTRWMPRHQETMKDVETCEKLWGAGLERRSIDLRIGKPGGRHGPSSYAEYIGVRG